MKVLGIIPARGGSKRIPGKNIRLFLNKPIIAYSIEIARSCGIFDELMVSTDDRQIAEIARQNGAAVPFMRSACNSNDYATTADVILEVIQEYQKIGRHFDFLCVIYPTAPFVKPERLKSGLQLLVEHQANMAMPVCRFAYPIQRAVKLNSGRIEMFSPEYAATRSQDLEPAYHDAGQYYWHRVSTFLKNPISGFSQAVPIVTPESEVQDIDTEDDWAMAEIKYRILHSVND